MVTNQEDGTKELHEYSDEGTEELSSYSEDSTANYNGNSGTHVNWNLQDLSHQSNSQREHFVANYARNLLFGEDDKKVVQKIKESYKQFGLAEKQEIIELIQKAKTPFEVVNVPVEKDGRTLLFLAVHRGDLELVKALVDLGANVNAEDKKGNIALFEARYDNAFEILQYFVFKGVAINHHNKEGMTYLHELAVGGDLSSKSYLYDIHAMVAYLKKMAPT